MNTTDLSFSSNRVADIEICFRRELASLYPDGEIGMFVRMLFESFLGWSQVDLLTRRNETVNQSDLLRFHWALHDLKRFRPIQHIIGYTDFCGCCITVDENTLVPRPETEEMVTVVINALKADPPRRILDICTGSGCIAIALAKQWPSAEVTGIDISEKALAKASLNATANNVNVDFVKADIQNSEFKLQNPKYDLIVSNPPYVMEYERSAMSRNVLDWEPSLALFVPDSDPLCFYRQIARIASDSLSPQGMLVAEINENLGKETLHLFQQCGFIGEIIRDFRGKERIVSLKRQNQ